MPDELLANWSGVHTEIINSLRNLRLPVSPQQIVLQQLTGSSVKSLARPAAW